MIASDDTVCETPAARLVTVGIPTYNRVVLLERAVAAVLAQTYPNIELLICDNASTDGTQQFAESLAADHDHVRYLRHARNLGPAANFQSARMNARGEYFMWLADDDWISPDYVERTAALLDTRPEVALASGVPTYWENGEPTSQGVCVQAVGADPVRRILQYYRQVDDNGIFYGLMRTSQLELLPPIPNRIGGDWLFLAGIAVLGELRTLPEIEIRRELRSGYTWRELARTSRLTRFEARYPYVAIAGFTAWQALWGSPVYRPLGVRRLVVALRAPLVIARRFVVTGLRPSSLRRRARNARARLAVRRSREK